MKPNELDEVDARIVAIFAAARRDGFPPLSPLFADEFRARPVSVPARAAIARGVRRLVRDERRLARLAGTTQARALLDAARVLDDPRHPGHARLAAADRALGASLGAVEALALRASLPDWLAARLFDELGERAARVASLVAVEAPLGLRAVPPSERDALLAALPPEAAAVAGAHSASAIAVHGVFDVWSSAAFRSGAIEVQDEASQLVAELCAPPERGLVLDACAGAGGKSLALGALMGGRGRIVALDPSRHKLAEARHRAARARLHTLEFVQGALGEPLPALESLLGRSDRVLVDAPCSGLGVLRRNPEARHHLTPENLEELRRTQAALLDAASGYVKPRGRLGFATCSFLPSEGVEQVERFLVEHPEFELVTAREVLGAARAAGITDANGRQLDTWASALDGAEPPPMDGFFAAVLRRR